MEDFKFETSQEIKELFSALLNFKKLVKKVPLNNENPFFKVAGKPAKYADLEDVNSTAEPHLLENNLVLSCIPSGDNYLVALLVHAPSGQFLKTQFKLNIQPTYDKEKDAQQKVIHRTGEYLDSQAWGAAVTYGRRIAISAILNLITDKDNDGNRREEKPEKQAHANSELPWLNPGKEGWKEAVKYLKEEDGDLDKLFEKYQISKSTVQKLCTEADYSK